MELGESTNLLTIDCASTYYQGHLTAPNSIEKEDVYLRLNNDLENFYSYLDKKVSKGNYFVFLFADLGGAHAEGFMENYKRSTGFKPELENALNNKLNNQFGVGQLVLGIGNEEVYFNNSKIEQKHLDKAEIIKALVVFIEKLPGVLYIVDASNATNAAILKRIREMIINGYNRHRIGIIKIIWKSGFLPSNDRTGKTHGLWITMHSSH